MGASAAAPMKTQHHTLIFYQFSRSKIERCDFSHFLSVYAPEKLPSGRLLREMMMNTLIFTVEGYDNDPREKSFDSGNSPILRCIPLTQVPQIKKRDDWLAVSCAT